MLKPTSGTVDAASTSTAAGMSACEKSSPNMAIATIKTMKVRARPYAMAKRQMPSRCVSLRTGAMKVYSIVPSHRSQAIPYAASMNTSERYPQSSAPTRRYSCAR